MTGFQPLRTTDPEPFDDEDFPEDVSADTPFTDPDPHNLKAMDDD